MPDPEPEPEPEPKAADDEPLVALTAEDEPKDGAMGPRTPEAVPAIETPSKDEPPAKEDEPPAKKRSRPVAALLVKSFADIMKDKKRRASNVQITPSRPSIIVPEPSQLFLFRSLSPPTHPHPPAHTQDLFERPPH